MQTPLRQRSRVSATCWAVTPPCQGLQDVDMDMGSRNLVLKLTSCQGKSNSELQGFHSSSADSLQTRGMMMLGLVLLREHRPRELLWAPLWAGSQPQPAFFSTNQCFHHLHAGLQTPDLSQSQARPHNSIFGFCPPLREVGEENLPLGF